MQRRMNVERVIPVFFAANSESVLASSLSERLTQSTSDDLQL